MLKGKLIVGDAAYCHRDICQTIVDSDGDYLVTVKANQPQLLRDIEQAFVISQGFPPRQLNSNTNADKRQRRRKSRGRVETRTVTTTTNIIDSKYLDWLGAKQIIRLERHTLDKGKVRQSTTYAITSLSRDQADANVLLSLLRGRWLIVESRFHILDAHLRDDHCRIRTGNAAQPCSSIRHAALNLTRKLRCSATAMC